MTMSAMVDRLVEMGFDVDKIYDKFAKGYRFTISKDDHYTSALFEYPADTSKAYCDQKQREFIDFIVDKWHNDHGHTQAEVKREKKLIFVGMANREIAFMFMNACIDSLHNSGVSIRYIDHERMIFRTSHTEVRYICFDRCSAIPDGLSADAIFGREVYRTALRLYAKPDVEEPGEKRIDLVDYICQVEQEATVTQIRDALYDSPDPNIQLELYAALMKGENNMPTRNESNIAALAAAFRNLERALNRKLPGIKTVHFSGPVTAVIWEDGTKSVVRCKDGEVPDYEKGFAMAIAKKALGTNKSGSNYYDIFKKYLPKPEEEEKDGDGV